MSFVVIIILLTAKDCVKIVEETALTVMQMIALNAIVDIMSISSATVTFAK